MSFSRTVAPATAVQQLVMPAVDVEALRSEDARRDRAVTPGPIRFAQPIAVDYDLESAGTWESLADGSRLWRLKIASPGALSLNLGFRRFDLPPGAALWIYDAVGARVEGPYTWRHRARDGQLWTPVILGDEIVLELHLPAGRGALLELGSVNHGYRFFGERKAKQGSCNIDVICAVVNPYRDLVRAVARYTRSGFTLCTGNLMNNTALDFRPLFLTAQHCGVNAANASSVVVYWNFEAPSCGQLSGGSLADNQTGATFLASDFTSDFALLELDRLPDASSNVHYAGWDASGDPAQSTVVIHHPDGDEKAAAFDDDPVLSVDIGRGPGTHWQVVEYDLGTTEPGSSGACLFDRANRGCVGWLTGGTAACDVPDGFDVFGKLSLAWTGGGTNGSRLSNWLDPVGGGSTTFLAGADPGPPEDPSDPEDPVEPGEPFTCVPDNRTLCLNDGRFQARARWRDFRGATGDAIASLMGDDDSGVFWFFAPTNGEILVKVLDGCGMNGHYWLFSAGATDVEYTLTVTDSTTGQSKTYGNQLGQPAPTVRDTTAFATCP